MTTTHTEAALDERAGLTNRRVAENVVAAAFRAGLTQGALAERAGITPATMSRKLKLRTDWTVVELVAMAEVLDVTPAELLGVLPSWDEWSERRACRDSNPKPSVLEPGLRLVPPALHAVKPDLTLVGRVTDGQGLRLVVGS